MLGHINGHLGLTEILTPNLIIHSFWNIELTLQDKQLKLKDLNICSYSIDRRQPSHACNVKGFRVILWSVHMMTVNMCLSSWSFHTYTPSCHSYYGNYARMVRLRMTSQARLTVQLIFCVSHPYENTVKPQIFTELNFH